MVEHVNVTFVCNFCTDVLLNVPKLILDSGAVTTKALNAPGHHGSICQNRSKSKPCATHLLDIPELILDWSCHHHGPDRPRSLRFHLPELHRITAKASAVPQTCWTFLSGRWICHHHSLDCPMSQRFHAPKWQQKRRPCHRSAGHS